MAHLPQLTLQPSVNTTTVVTTTTTTTTYAPIPLPPLPPPSEPKDPKNYPLLHATLPQSLRQFPLTFPGGARAVFSDGIEGEHQMHDEQQLASGHGWRMLRPDHDENTNNNVLGLAEALERYGKKRAHDDEPTPRKKQRVPAAPPSPPPESIWPSAPPSPPPPQQAPFQPDLSLTTLLTLPSLVSHFNSLPPQLQSHLLLTLLRHSPLPVLRTLHSVLTPTLARDFLTLLPPELVSHVLSFLPFPTLVRASRVSKAWRAIIDSDPVLWRDLLKSTKIWFGGESENAFSAAINARRRHSPHPPSPLPLPHPYKILFKSRHLTRTKWINNPDPRHISFPAHGRSVVTCLIFSHGRIISASDDHSIHVYSPLTGKLEKKLQGHQGGVWALAASGDVLVSGSTDRTVRIWDLKQGKCKHVFGGHTSTVRCLAVVKPEIVEVHDEETGVVRRERWPKRPLIVTGSRDHSLRVWTLPKKNEPEYKSVGYDQDDANNPRASVADIDSDTCDAEENPYHRLHLEGHDHAVRALAARGRTLVSGSYDCTVRIWDIITGNCKWVLVGHTQKVYSVVLDPSRNQACSGSMDGTVRIWSILNGTCLHTLTGHTSLVGLLGLSPSYLVSAAADSTLRIWDPNTGALKHTLAAHTGAITCFQHDEFKVLSGSDGTLKMWDVREGVVVRDLLVGITGVWQVAFEGRWCVSASNRSDVTVLDVWDFGRTGGNGGSSSSASGLAASAGQTGTISGAVGPNTSGEGEDEIGSGVVGLGDEKEDGGEDAYIGEEDWVGEPPGGMYDEEWDEEQMYEEEDEDPLAPKFSPAHFSTSRVVELKDTKGKQKQREREGIVSVRGDDAMDIVVDEDSSNNQEDDIDASMDGLSPRPMIRGRSRTPSRSRSRSRLPTEERDDDEEATSTMSTTTSAGSRFSRALSLSREDGEDNEDEEQDPIEVEVELIPQSQHQRHHRQAMTTARTRYSQRTTAATSTAGGHHRTRATTSVGTSSSQGVVTRRAVSSILVPPTTTSGEVIDAEMESVGGGDDDNDNDNEDSGDGEQENDRPSPSPGPVSGTRRSGNRDSTRSERSGHGHATRKRWV
ncbi:WD40 repeat-like protein [Dendrothele bispora CBS 962.96]|uniref:WD40 repeat-like protein n=1 Tax=Dendrothele bispora (strain CBS 962.96) TaxID=1314807 RepID=A0A4S8KZS5_DENBC|nr:WD40 repeat-like protein [Dendrothele bispora CBS 962.96]